MTGFDYMRNLLPNFNQYPFTNLVTVDLNQPAAHHQFTNRVSFVSNYNYNEPMPLSSAVSDVFAIANDTIHNLWSKTEFAKNRFAQLTNSHLNRKEFKRDLVDELFKLAANDAKFYPDRNLSRQGEGYIEEYLTGLSSINTKISNPPFGSRTKTVLLVDKNLNCDWIEKNFDESHLFMSAQEELAWPRTELKFSFNDKYDYNSNAVNLARL